MRVRYYRDSDIQDVRNGNRSDCAASLYDHPGVAVFLETEKGQSITGFEVIGAEPAILSNKGYDAETDILLFGDRADDSALVKENDDFVTHWRKVKLGEESNLFPIGVGLRNASRHLAPVMVAMQRTL